jgi:hypothetical protein
LIASLQTTKHINRPIVLLSKREFKKHYKTMSRRKEKSTYLSKLPKKLRALFWDYDFENLTWKKDRNLITGRVLAAGGLDAIQWLRYRLGDRALAEWIERRQGQGLTPKQLRFWELILGLSHQEVNSWLKTTGRKIWENRTNP